MNGWCEHQKWIASVLDGIIQSNVAECPWCKDIKKQEQKKSLAEVLQNCFIREDRPKQQAQVAADAAKSFFIELVEAGNCFTCADGRIWVEKNKLIEKVREV